MLPTNEMLRKRRFPCVPTLRHGLAVTPKVQKQLGVLIPKHAIKKIEKPKCCDMKQRYHLAKPNLEMKEMYSKDLEAKLLGDSKTKTKLIAAFKSPSE